MKKILYLFLPVSFMLLALSACKPDEIPADCDEIHWEYNGEHGAEHWDKVCTDYKACGGQAQSPIDIMGANWDTTLMPLQMVYNNSQTNIYNNGHTLQYNYTPGSTLTLNGEVYELLQFHFHAGSEHSIDGTRYPAEVHLVHKNAASGALAVVGVMFTYGAENPTLEYLFNKLPKKEGEYYRSSKEYNVSGLLPANKSYYTYSGSLTTPPCSEIVNWFVMANPITASDMQINRMTKLFYSNARPIQPLNGREIKLFQ